MALRYHGGKWMLGPWVISHFPDHRVYVEPFGGAANVLLRKERSYAEVYNELHPGVVNLFRVLRDPDLSRDLKRLAELTPFAHREFDEAWPAEGDGDLELARKMLVRSFMGHGSNSVTAASGFRSNSNRLGSTPARDWSRWPDRIDAISERLRGVVIENVDACAVMERHDAPSTLHYVDPPYVTATRTAKNGYALDFTDADHERLAECLYGLSGMVVLSGYPSELYGNLYAEWEMVSRSALADGARKRTECLWLNPAASQALIKHDLLGDAA